MILALQRVVGRLVARRSGRIDLESEQSTWDLNGHF